MNYLQSLSYGLLVFVMINVVVGYGNYKNMPNHGVMKDLYSYLRTISGIKNNMPGGLVSFTIILFINCAVAPIYFTNSKPIILLLYQLTLVVASIFVGANIFSGRARIDSETSSQFEGERES